MTFRFALIAPIMGILSTIAVAGPLPTDNPVPGGIAVVDIGAQSETVPRTYFGQSEISLVSDSARWIALVGLAQDTVCLLYTSDAADD